MFAPSGEKPLLPATPTPSALDSDGGMPTPSTAESLAPPEQYEPVDIEKLTPNVKFVQVAAMVVKLVSLMMHRAHDEKVADQAFLPDCCSFMEMLLKVQEAAALVCRDG